MNVLPQNSQIRLWHELGLKHEFPLKIGFLFRVNLLNKQVVYVFHFFYLEVQFPVNPVISR